MSSAEPAGDGRLLWRCRRGMKELDVLLERYVQVLKAGAAASERRAFARLLDFADPDLAAYLLGHATPPDPELAELVRRIAAGAGPSEERR
ncbi:MAG TPA: succinate dehydrogenase assembly factor 2 [Steroidobacteraceae bacterium]|jgi:antitoxin CptB